VPHKGEIQIDARSVTYQISSNGFETTRDMANRMSIVRIRKRPARHTFKAFAEGDLLAHCRTHQGYYLAAIYAVIRNWVESGCPQNKIVDHDFRAWADTLDWIVTNILGTANLLDGHRAAQERVSNPTLTWLRTVCLAAERMGKCGIELKAKAIAHLCDEAAIDLPRRSPTAAAREAAQHVGRLLSQAFREANNSNLIKVDGFEIWREEREEKDTSRKTVPVKIYRIERLPE
jgi:hypothetical protein